MMNRTHNTQTKTFSRTKTGVMTAMTLSLAMAAGSAQALTLYTAGPGSLAKKLAAGYENKPA